MADDAVTGAQEFWTELERKYDDLLMGKVDALGPLDGRHVLVFHNMDVDAETIKLIADHLAACAAARGEVPSNGDVAAVCPLIVNIHGDESVEALDEAQMAEHGWVRAGSTKRTYELAGLLADLDRCEHGRHEGDACYGCRDGVSQGNPVLGWAANYGNSGTEVPRQIGYQINGKPLVVPDRQRKHDPEAWRG